MKTKILAIFLALIAIEGKMYAEDYPHVKIGDLYYYLNGTNKTASVTFDYNSYAGLINAVIPSSVSYNNIAYSVIRIEGGAFEYCESLTSVTINAAEIGEKAFNNCRGLTSVTIGENVSSIQTNAFAACVNLETVTINSSSIISDGDEYTTRGKIEICGLGRFPKEYIIGENITRIGNRAFSKCSAMTSVTIPNSVTNISAYAFEYCENLASVAIPNSVTSIGDCAFNECRSLASVTIPNSVTSIGWGAFRSCTSLDSVTIPNSITSIEDGMFFECLQLTSVTIPNSVTSIGAAAFASCALPSVTIPNSVTSIGAEAFYGCERLRSMTIPNSVTSIGGYAFYGCKSMKSIAIPNGVTSIEAYTFMYCDSLASVTIPNSVTVIDLQAFYACGLESVTIPSSVNFIQVSAFDYCRLLKSVTIEAETPPTEGNAFNYTYCPIYVPCSSVDAYKSAWSKYADRIKGNCASITITFVNWDGSTLLTLNVAEGDVPQYIGITPTRPEDEEYTYTFIGWSPEIVPATEDATYIATYEATPKSQDIEETLSAKTKNAKFMRNGQLLIETNGKIYNVIGAEVK